MLFVRVGSHDINMSQVTDIYYGSNGNVIFNFTGPDGDGQASIVLYGANAAAFKEAWDCGIAGVVIYQVD